MLPARSLRWAGAGISNGRQRLLQQNRGIRNFSINTSSTRIPRVTRLSSSANQGVLQQTRSLSLFGWGGSSKPIPESRTTTSSTDIDLGPIEANLENVRTVKASLATSDAPEPSQAHLHPPNQVEPQFIENLQQTITLPHGDASGLVSDIASGATDISSTPERMGYLKEVCGLDFGWGFSTIMENVLESLHVHGGLSWTASIVAVAVILRLAMILPIISSQRQASKMREVQPYVKPLREKYAQLRASGNQAKANEIGMQIREINNSAGISITKAFVPLLIQIPFGFGAFRVLRNAGQLPVPAFVTENWLWTTDLSFSDPYYLTPAISAAAIWLSFRTQQAGQQTAFGPEMMKIFGTALPLLSFAFMSFQPGAVQLYFMTTGVLAFATTSALRQPWVRKITRLGPLAGPDPTKSGATAQPIKPLPSNIQRFAPAPSSIPVKATVTESEHKSERSVVDKVLEKGKGLLKGLNTKQTKGILSDRLAKQEKERKQANSARYNATRQMQLDNERKERNAKANGS